MTSKDEKLKSILDNSEKDVGSLGFLFAILVGIVTLGIFLFLWKRGRVNRRGICLVGLCESGKTLLFTQLIYKKAMDSFTSLKENVGVLDVPNKGTLKLVDIPGHERVRQRFFDSYKSSARGIIFVLDSFTVTKDIRDVSEYLYNILSDSVVASNRPQVLILCNKQDHALSKGPQVILNLIEKEMNLLRNTKMNQLEDVVADGSKKTYFGRQGKDFEFRDLLPLKVEFAASSAEAGEMDQIHKWLQAVA